MSTQVKRDVRHAEQDERREQVIEDVEFLLSCRTYPAEIAARLGYGDVRSLGRALYRWGRGDLGVRMDGPR